VDGRGDSALVVTVRPATVNFAEAIPVILPVSPAPLPMSAA
jgi:hypothetical protein